MNPYLPYFFGPRADYYNSVLEDMDEGKTRFNEGAFFFGMFWIVYRKMYANAVIAFGLIMAESALEDWLIPQLSSTPAYILGSNLVIASLIGFIGNRLYLSFARKQVAHITQNQPDPATPDPAVVQQLRAEGGVSWVGPAVMLLVYALLTAGVFFLTM